LLSTNKKNTSKVKILKPGRLQNEPPTHCSNMQAISTPSSGQNEAEAELEVCISCLKTNPPGTSFCRHCGTPLTSYAATAPFESLFAEGDFWRKAVRQAKDKPLRRILILLFLVLMISSILLGLLLR
jgi:hypothetical protein